MTTSNPWFHIPSFLAATAVLSGEEKEKFDSLSARAAELGSHSRRFNPMHLDQAEEDARAAYAAAPSQATLGAYHAATIERRNHTGDVNQILAVPEHTLNNFLRIQFAPWAIAFLERLVAVLSDHIAQFIAAEQARAV